MNEKKICPKCGTRSMVRKRLPSGKYTMVCEKCGSKRDEFVEDTKKGVV
ncbi:MAG: hypothetical protein IBX40_10545 [Methanosarcinales archaeon]|nr:hypothetical protein [Methanosarcinales archaeon]